MTMKFVKQSFMGIELDVLIGHPEHDVLFIATQVARAAGLKDPAGAVNNAKRNHEAGLTLGTLMANHAISPLPKDTQGRSLRKTILLFTEGHTYDMLLRGHAPQSEPFRKWVTEEVLPSIRKTGTYNIHESETKEAQQFAGEFAQLHSAISELTSEVLSLKEIIAGCQKPSL
ncbi:BRO-N domain-containing protein [Pseudomonas putida]|uniref:BRO-N domain-containing protein n=1 Tax=Pseudomonas putida TaxID=303 RepID=UPI003CFD04A4